MIGLKGFRGDPGDFGPVGMTVCYITFTMQYVL